MTQFGETIEPEVPAEEVIETTADIETVEG